MSSIKSRAIVGLSLITLFFVAPATLVWSIFCSADIAKASEWLAASAFYRQQMKRIFTGVESRGSLLVTPKPVVAVAPRVHNCRDQPSMFTPSEVNDMTDPVNISLSD